MIRSRRLIIIISSITVSQVKTQFLPLFSTTRFDLKCHHSEHKNKSMYINIYIYIYIYIERERERERERAYTESRYQNLTFSIVKLGNRICIFTFIVLKNIGSRTHRYQNKNTLHSVKTSQHKIRRRVGYSSDDGQYKFYSCLAYFKVNITLEDKAFKKLS
jgi:hypothetical protein